MKEGKKMAFFERNLTIWVLICIALGIVIGHFSRDEIQVMADWKYSGVNIPVAVLVWAMIYPMMVQIDFSSLKNVLGNKKGIALTVLVNWLVRDSLERKLSWVSRCPKL